MALTNHPTSCPVFLAKRKNECSDLRELTRRHFRAQSGSTTYPENLERTQAAGNGASFVGLAIALNNTYTRTYNPLERALLHIDPQPYASCAGAERAHLLEVRGGWWCCPANWIYTRPYWKGGWSCCRNRDWQILRRDAWMAAPPGVLYARVEKRDAGERRL